MSPRRSATERRPRRRLPRTARARRAPARSAGWRPRWRRVRGPSRRPPRGSRAALRRSPPRFQWRARASMSSRRCRAPADHAFQRLAGASVQLGPAAEQEALVRDLLEERVGEPVAAISRRARHAVVRRPRRVLQEVGRRGAAPARSRGRQGGSRPRGEGPRRTPARGPRLPGARAASRPGGGRPWRAGARGWSAARRRRRPRSVHVHPVSPRTSTPAAMRPRRISSR